MAENLARVLSRHGESIVLAGTRARRRWATFFATEPLGAGMVRVVPAFGGDGEGRISLIRYDLDATGSGPGLQDEAMERLLRLGEDASRILLDLSDRDGWFLRRLARPGLDVVVPVDPTMSSVISLQAIERFFRDMVDDDGRMIQPKYLIHSFDEKLGLHRDVRDFLRRQVGDRLLPFALRGASGDGEEAMAEGLDSGHAEDYAAVAEWLRDACPCVVPPARSMPRSRWSG